MLKPDTSSDSPSAKSKGVRLVSATQEINHNPAIGKHKKSLNKYSAVDTIKFILNLGINIIKNIIINANLIS